VVYVEWLILRIKLLRHPIRSKCHKYGRMHLRTHFLLALRKQDLLDQLFVGGQRKSSAADHKRMQLFAQLYLVGRKVRASV
jgi:hypothetical protein